jgi:O-antigen ligase
MMRACEIGLMVTLAVAVAAFGGTETRTWSAVEFVVLLLGVALVVARPWAAETIRRRWTAPAALLALVMAQWLAPFEPLASADPWATRELFVRLLVYGCAYAVARSLGTDPSAARRIVFALIALGILEAVYGLAQYLTGWQKIFWFEKVYYRESATGTYVNHNHFAGFLEMVIPFAVAQVAVVAQRRRSATDHSEHAGLLGILAAVMLLAVVFSESRMGLIACLISLAAMAGVLGLRGRHPHAPGIGPGVIVALVALTAALVLWLGLDPVIARFADLPDHEGLRVDQGGRMALWQDTLRLIAVHPVFGVGLGGFEAAYTKVQTLEVGARVDYAHNDYLQIAAELGVAGALLFWGMIFAVGARTLRACWSQKEAWRRSVALGATGALGALLLHSLTDFNLYVPANGLVFAVVMGLGRAAADERESRQSTDEAAK